MSNNTEIFCSILEEEKQKLEWWLFNKIIIGELKPCDLCEDWFGAGAAPWQASPRCLAKHPSPTSGTSCNTSLSKLLSIRICIYTLVTRAALIKKAEQSWHGVPGGTAKVNRSWEAVSRVTVCWAFTTGSLIKTERKNLSSASALYHFYLQKEYFVSYKVVDSGARGALHFHHYLQGQSSCRASDSLWLPDYPQNSLFLAQFLLWITECIYGSFRFVAQGLMKHGVSKSRQGVAFTEGCVFHCSACVCQWAGAAEQGRQ